MSTGICHDCVHSEICVSQSSLKFNVKHFSLVSKSYSERFFDTGGDGKIVQGRTFDLSGVEVKTTMIVNEQPQTAIEVTEVWIMRLAGYMHAHTLIEQEAFFILDIIGADCCLSCVTCHWRL